MTHMMTTARNWSKYTSNSVVAVDTPDCDSIEVSNLGYHYVSRRCTWILVTIALVITRIP